VSFIPKPVTYALLATLLWSTVATAFKLGLIHFEHDVASLLILSVFFSVLFLLTFSVFENQHRAFFPSGRQILISSFSGLLNPFLYYLIVFKAYDLLPASEAQPLNYIWPITLSIFSAVTFKYRLRLRQVAAMVLGFFGVAVISTHGRFDLTFSNPFGVCLAVGSSLIWAGYWVINIRDRRSALQKMRLNFMFGFLYLLLFLGLTGRWTLPDFTGVLCAAWIGLCEMGLTFILWMRALNLARAGSVSHIVYLSPFLSLLWINRILGETIRGSSVAGLCLIICGILVGTRQVESHELIK
jgi:drug/metabolite transporter (DMT)-like permease